MDPESGEHRLFAAIRRGKLKPGAAEEFAKRVQGGALPIMKQMDGFKGYCLVVGADDVVIAVSLFSSQAVAEGSTTKLMPWIKENLGPLLASSTEAMDGAVVVSA
ncbi:MAG: antibiotic biosynthesis monooxygenase [Hyphomicrobiales bacterium]|nr:antibiotic biosynthesis monooxygenase [Hyphomicrobiales bacterium]MDE2017168.1 antibiotic biosynthesis monooxygenase [Hyphomicrobiales bacterium]